MKCYTGIQLLEALSEQAVRTCVTEVGMSYVAVLWGGVIGCGGCIVHAAPPGPFVNRLFTQQCRTPTIHVHGMCFTAYKHL